MSYTKDTAEADCSIFHFLYIDSNPKNWYQLSAELNPPRFSTRSIVEKYWKETSIHPNYNLLFTYASNFKEALYLVAHHNIDDAYLQFGYQYPFDCPFNGIIFELKSRTSPTAYKWDKFLEDLSSLGLRRLNLSDGLIAFTKRYGTEIKDLLIRYQIRKVIKYKDFSLELLKAELVDYLNLIHGSNYFELEKQIIFDESGQVNYVDRRVKFEDSAQRERTLHLSRIMVNEEEHLSYLSDIPDNEDFSCLGLSADNSDSEKFDNIDNSNER